jgi:hypothetical protein
VYTGDDNNDKKDLVNIDDNDIKKKKKKPKPIVIEPVKAGMKKEKKNFFLFTFSILFISLFKSLIYLIL